MSRNQSQATFTTTTREATLSQAAPFTGTARGWAVLRAVLGAVGWVLLPSVGALLLAAWALTQPWAATVQVGELFDRPFLEGFHSKEYSSEQAVSFRWSQPEAQLTLPGAGAETLVTLRIYNEQPATALTLELGNKQQQLNLRAGWQQLHLLPPPDAFSGDLQIGLATPPQTSADDPRQRGLVLDWVALQGQPALPPPGQVVLLSVSVALMTLLVGWASQRRWVGMFAGCVLAVGLTAVLLYEQGAARLLLTSATGRLVLVLATGGLLALVFERLLGWLDRREVVRLTAPVRRGLAAVALLAFVLRFGGLAYPLTYNSDLPIILGRTWMVREGQLGELFFPNPTLTPVQWESDITVPRSPFFYILTTPLTLLPNEGTGDKLGLMAFSSAVDALAVVLVALLVCLVSGGSRAALLAAFLAATLPPGLLFTVSWGILPTLFGQMLALLTVVLWILFKPRLQEWRPWLLLTAALALTFLAYPTALLFLGVTGLLLVGALALQRDPATLPTLTAALVALVVAFGCYYGWHVPAMVSNTLPTLLGGAATAETGGTWFDLQRLGNALGLQLVDKFGILVLLLAAGGLLLLLRAPLTGRARDTRLVLLAWSAAFVPLALADEYIVTFILKHLLHILPMVAIGGGLLLGRLSATHWGTVVAWVVMGLVLWQGLLLELDVIVNGFVQLK